MIRLSHGECAIHFSTGLINRGLVRQWVELDQLLHLGENDGTNEWNNNC